MPNALGVPIDVGSRLELMIDDHLIARLSGGVALHLNTPIPREVVMVTDEPWEGNACGYFSVFQDGDIYRMYYRGWHFVVAKDSLDLPHGEVVCYAESDDGIHWTRPDLGLVEFSGSKRNNIILPNPEVTSLCSSFQPFRDENPHAEPDARYKAWAVGFEPRGLYPLKSADGIHWAQMTDGPAITYGAFDSANIAFWDPTRGEYRDYHRNQLEREPYAARVMAGTFSPQPHLTLSTGRIRSTSTTVRAALTSFIRIASFRTTVRHISSWDSR